MSNPNEALNLLAKIIVTTEKQVLAKANYIDYLQQKKAKEETISQQAYELANLINDHEDLQNKFAELLTTIENAFSYAMQAKNLMQAALFEVEHLKLVNKDTLHWKQQADYWKNSCKLFVANQKKLEDQINKLTNAKNIQFG